uniref:Uncharacterized protein n=1 Tax=Mycena chlorophos TaxID=658473 RepID=A0ABQ0LMA2_MYCCL|nr:predicted protein [Mycena chlorophos]
MPLHPVVSLLVVALSAASVAAQGASTPSPAPQNPNFYYPPYTCPDGSQDFFWDFIVIGVEDAGSLYCTTADGAYCHWDMTTDTLHYDSDGGGACPETALAFSASHTCNFYLCGNYAPDNSPLSNVEWPQSGNDSTAGDGSTICNYGEFSSGGPSSTTTCVYDTEGNIDYTQSDYDNCYGDVIPAPCASTPNRRRYRQEDNLTAMLRRKAAAGEIIRVAKPRSS